jgi:hypothetical protein
MDGDFGIGPSPFLQEAASKATLKSIAHDFKMFVVMIIFFRIQRNKSSIPKRLRKHNKSITACFSSKIYFTFVVP